MASPGTPPSPSFDSGLLTHPKVLRYPSIGGSASVCLIFLIFCIFAVKANLLHYSPRTSVLEVSGSISNSPKQFSFSTPLFQVFF
jgi:hypothetical protein